MILLGSNTKIMSIVNKSRGTITASWVKLKRGGSGGKRHVMKVAMMWTTSVCVFRVDLQNSTQKAHIYGDGAKSEIRKFPLFASTNSWKAVPLSAIASTTTLPPVQDHSTVLFQKCRAPHRTCIRSPNKHKIVIFLDHNSDAEVQPVNDDTPAPTVRQTKSVENKGDSDLEVYRHARVPVKIEPCTVPVFNDVLGCFIQIITVDHASFMYCRRLV